MCENLGSNPFAGLFSTDNDAISFSSQHVKSVEVNDASYAKQSSDEIEDKFESALESVNSHDQVDDQLMARVFGLTLHEDSDAQESLVFIDADSVEHAVFERLMLPDPKPRAQNVDSHVVETQVITYLYECYCRLKHYQVNGCEDAVTNACQIVLRNANTALQEPALFQSQQVHSQFVALFMDDVTSKTELSSFISGIIEELIAANSESDVDNIIKKTFAPILNIIHKETAQSNLFTFRHQWFDLLSTFSTIEPLAKFVVHHSTPRKKEQVQGCVYSETLLGTLFNISCLPKKAKDPYDLFENPLQQPNTIMEGTIWAAMDNLSKALYKVFHSLLKCSTEVRHLTLQWLGNCLYTNASRGKLWNSQVEMGLLGRTCVSDGFMLNIGNVLLRLCQPFCAKLNDAKVPKIDPTYCSTEAKDEAESLQRGIHMKGLSSETCLIPTPEGESRPMSDTFGFVTECFFLTHRALDLGYRVILDKFSKSNQTLALLQRHYNEARATTEPGVTQHNLEEMLLKRMETEMKKYLSFKASLLTPEMLEHLTKFHAMTAFWLVQVNLHVATEEEGKQNFIPNQYTPVTFPLSETVPITLRCIPEFVVENTIGFLCFLRRVSPNTFEEQGPSFLNPILTEIIILMESQHRLYNPHIRASLAESLEALLPIVDENVAPAAPNLGTFHREQLFLTHPHRQQIVVNLLHVFVSIEMTGQSVQFEQKFNYRRPMYIVMDYLWQIVEHRNNFITLAQEAEDNMEAVQPPLFLRFINLLMNDAVFLLDEALSNMAQLRQINRTRLYNRLYPNLAQEEIGQNEAYFEHIGMIARFDNILGRKTIQTIKMLTTEIKSIFCHPTMVDRIASMLNYLLLQLVGPNQKNLKVNDQKEYAFKPANLVLSICEIYINLSKNDSFTLAVSQDGRSYTPELFKLAENVLVRIGGVGILEDLNQFAKNVEKAANQKREEDEVLTDAPDEFLDPIMSTVMMDPVILPSSKVTIDRQTIARHLLSDQTDPFNRSPLTMDMVKSNVELQREIQEWISKKKLEKTLRIDT